MAAFLPVSEIAQVGRQLADTIASTRRLHLCVHHEPPPVVDGAQLPAAPVGGSSIRFEGVGLRLSRRAAAGARAA